MTEPENKSYALSFAQNAAYFIHPSIIKNHYHQKYQNHR